MTEARQKYLVRLLGIADRHRAMTLRKCGELGLGTKECRRFLGENAIAVETGVENIAEVIQGNNRGWYRTARAA
jgi:hypothetical protein